jgi:hypothetical protein
MIHKVRHSLFSGTRGRPAQYPISYHRERSYDIIYHLILLTI